MHVNVLLADSAQTAEGKLYCLGVGWTQMGSLAPHAVTVVATFETGIDDVDTTGGPRNWALALFDEDEAPVFLPNEQPVRVEGALEVSFPEGQQLVRVPMAMQVPPLGLPAGRYSWRFTIDGFSDAGWEAAFEVRAQEGED